MITFKEFVFSEENTGNVDPKKEGSTAWKKLKRGLKRIADLQNDRDFNKPAQKSRLPRKVRSDRKRPLIRRSDRSLEEEKKGSNGRNARDNPLPDHEIENQELVIKKTTRGSRVPPKKPSIFTRLKRRTRLSADEIDRQVAIPIKLRTKRNREVAKKLDEAADDNNSAQKIMDNLTFQNSLRDTRTSEHRERDRKKEVTEKAKKRAATVAAQKVGREILRKQENEARLARQAKQKENQRQKEEKGNAPKRADRMMDRLLRKLNDPNDSINNRVPKRKG